MGELSPILPQDCSYSLMSAEEEDSLIDSSAAIRSPGIVIPESDHDDDDDISCSSPDIPPSDEEQYAEKIRKDEAMGVNPSPPCSISDSSNDSFRTPPTSHNIQSDCSTEFKSSQVRSLKSKPEEFQRRNFISDSESEENSVVVIDSDSDDNNISAHSTSHNNHTPSPKEDVSTNDFSDQNGSTINYTQGQSSVDREEHYNFSSNATVKAEIDGQESKIKEEEWIEDGNDPDGSLLNSPVGATRAFSPAQRKVSGIVSELSMLRHDINVQKTLLESIQRDHLPDHGENLVKRVNTLQKREIELEAELAKCEDLKLQKAGFEHYQKLNETTQQTTKQTTLNFNFPVKTEPLTEIELNNTLEEDDDVDDQDVTQAPKWGDLPRPDASISHFGKQAMQTHLTEKALTLEALTKLHNALKTCPAEDQLEEDPRGLKVDLMPHQKHGLAWMLWREKESPSGGILADDMGLGKTLSMIALILKSRELKEEENGDSDSDSENDSPSSTWMNSKVSRMQKGGTLVVCPATLIEQWEREIYKRTKRRLLEVDLYHGARRETRPKRLARQDIVITTYHLLSRESGTGPLHQIKWERIILDEAHMVRNHKSQMAVAVCELMAKHRWCLTGTPIHNKELDLYALLKFLQCSPFDDLTVWKRWVENKSAAGMTRLNTMMKSLMLRRTKEQLQERGDLNCLPEKSFERIDVHLDPEELDLYEKVAVFSSTLFSQFLDQRKEKQLALDARYGFSNNASTWRQGDQQDEFATGELAAMHRKMQGISNIKTHQILVLLLRLRQICCHPGLVKKMVESGELDIDGAVEDENGLDVNLFAMMNDLNINENEYERQLMEEEKQKQAEVLSVDNPVLSFDRPSAKIRAVLEVLENKILDTEDKAIVVSQWTSVLNVISKFLEERNVKFTSLTGEVPVNKRQDIVTSFNKVSSGPQVLLLSLTAGGVGLNLVGANHLILVDIHWNPQLEAQACDRIYRVGQKKHVFVYRLITSDTIEERIKLLQDKKLSLADSVLTGTKNTEASKLTLDDLKLLFAAPVHPPPGPPPVQDNRASFI